MRGKLQTISRESALGVYCPACSAGPFERCKDSNGVARQGIHLERFLVIEKDSRLTQLSIFDSQPDPSKPDLFGILTVSPTDDSQGGFDLGETP